MTDAAVAIIGAGASGALAAAHLHRTAPALRVAVVDAGARAARGLAYGTPYGAHLLNVPAGRMSALAYEPDHFVSWLAHRGHDASPHAFVPRHLYGDYLADVLARITEPPSRISRIAGSAVGLTRDDGSWRVHLHDGRLLRVSSIVLALGNLPPADPLHLGDGAPAQYLRDPWAPGAAQGLAHDAEILLIGTGLTMVDLVLALRDEGHRGRIHAISRRGVLPQAHAAHLPRAVELPEDRSPAALLAWLRRESRNGDWRAVVDALRPHTAAIWQSWHLRERASFLRHARVFWDVHRHRAAPEVAAAIANEIGTNRLSIYAGRIVAMRAIGSGLEVDAIARTGDPIRFSVARAINCTGPASDYGRVDLPLVVQMRRAGWLVPDPLGLGIEADANGRLVGSDGIVVPALFTIGPLRRPQLWESTAIPEIREQAAALAMLLRDEQRGDRVVFAP